MTANLISAAACSVKPTESIVKAILIAAAALAPLSLATQGAAAQTAEQAALGVVAPFYDGLNAAPGKDIAGVLRQATAPEWVSCGTNDVCGAREQVIAAIVGRHKAIPDLKWEIKEVLVSGNRVTVRGEAHSVALATERSLGHTAYHVGQIVLLARHWAGEQWTTLTIARGGSEAYNRAAWSGGDYQRRAGDGK